MKTHYVYNRKVKRVLVMVEYDEPGADGEIFDITQLANEVGTKSSEYTCDVNMSVKSERSYDRDHPERKLFVSWNGYCGGNFTGSAGHLADVINCILPDNDRVIDLRKKAKRCIAKAEKLDMEARYEKLEQVAQIRAQHPIATVKEVPALEHAKEIAL